jgi:hypothetical protein
MAQAAGHDDRALRRRVTRLEAIVLELAAASRPSLVPRLMGNEPGSSSADVSLEQLPSGRWVAWGGKRRRRRGHARRGAVQPRSPSGRGPDHP